jgi:GDPmannose 4,6-dehydratase
MLQQPQPDDYVIGTGEARSVRDLVQAAFKAAEIDGWEKYVRVDPRFFRPAEVEFLLADAAKARAKLGWQPRIGFEEMIREMYDSDLARLTRTEARLEALERRPEALEGHGPA